MMKTNSVLFLSFWLILSACSNPKKTTNDSVKTNENSMKATLIDGSWEANYIMNTPKTFDELFAKAKPTITFNSLKSEVSGMAGCNNFTGNFTLDGNKIGWGNGLALTRKMCPDMTGEQTFLETLKKVNTYSVTDQGKTLNLIMGDMAVMRLSRK